MQLFFFLYYDTSKYNKRIYNWKAIFCIALNTIGFIVHDDDSSLSIKIGFQCKPYFLVNPKLTEEFFSGRTGQLEYKNSHFSLNF